MFTSIKSKLIASFALVTLLVIILASFAISKTNESSTGFADYREMAKDTVLAGLVQSNMLMVRMNMKDYLRNPVEKEVQEFNHFYQQTFDLIAKAKEEIQKHGRNALVAELDSNLTLYQQDFLKVQNLMQHRIRLAEETLQPNGRKIETLLTQIMSTSEANDNHVNALKTAKAIRTLMLGRLYASRFIANSGQGDMDRALQEFDNLKSAMKEVQGTVRAVSSKQKFDQAEALVNQNHQAILEIYSIIQELNTVVSKMDQVGPKMAKLADEIKSSIKQDQDTIGPMVQELNESIIVAMIAIAIIILSITLTIGTLIPRSISRVLNEIEQKLTTISLSGDFSIRADESRKDEIGAMAKAVNSMLSNMQTAISQANQVVNAIAKGQFQERVTLEVSGDLLTLKNGINHSAESISQTMNELSRMMQAMSNGQFNIEMNVQVEGEFKAMMDNASSTMFDLNATINGIIVVMEKMQNGYFEDRCMVEAKGDLERLKQGINHSMTALDSAMKDIISIVVAQSEGDLTKTITNEYHGELNVLKQSINNTSAKLIQVVSQALHATSIVNSASDEVSRGALDLSERVQEQAAALEETSATMDEMNSQVQSNTQNAIQASEEAEKVLRKAENGTHIMQETINAMNAIQESSNSISAIVALIDGIAFQTNLLALNAAVEAARAGEHGRGFAVVASEVRSLAQKSAEAAKDITQLINQTVERVNHGSTLATASGEMLHEINDSIQVITQMITHIAQASAEQAEGVSQVHQAVSQIDEVTQQNAALVEETSAAAESMSEQAAILNQDMAFFKTGAKASVASLISHPPKDETITMRSLPTHSKPNSAMEWSIF